MKKEKLQQSFIDSWSNFVNSVHTLIKPSIDDRGLDQFLPLRDYVIALMLDKDFIDLLKTHSGSVLEETSNELNPLKVKIMNALIMELMAFPIAVEITQTISKPEPTSDNWIKKWLGKASTVTGSVKDFVEHNPTLKTGITVFNEVIDIFKGD